MATPTRAPSTSLADGSLIDLSGEVGGGVLGPGADHGEVVTERGDVADLATRPDFLAVQVDANARVRGPGSAGVPCACRRTDRRTR